MLLLEENSMNKENYRILVVHNYYKIPGGEDTVVQNEMKMLEDAGHYVMLYARHNSELEQMSKIGKLCLPLTTIFSVRTYRDIKKIIRENKIDVVHVHNTLNLISPAVYYAALRCKVPVIQTIHNFRLLCPAATCYRDGKICEDCIEKNLGCAVKHSCYRNSKIETLACVMVLRIHRIAGIYKKLFYICLTEFNKQMLLKQGQIKPTQIFVKPNTVVENPTYPIVKKRKDQFVFAGRLDELKGIEILLEAWKKMGNTAPTLIVCGTGPKETWVRKFVKENHLMQVELRGFVSQDAVKEIMAESKGMILPTQWYEGFPMSIVEAFSVGTPVIGSDIGNVGSIIVNGVNGRKFTPSSSDELVECVRNMNVSNDSVFRYYSENYAQEINLDQLCEIYEKAIIGIGNKI